MSCEEAPQGMTEEDAARLQASGARRRTSGINSSRMKERKASAPPYSVSIIGAISGYLSAAVTGVMSRVRSRMVARMSAS